MLKGSDFPQFFQGLQMKKILTVSVILSMANVSLMACGDTNSTKVPVKRLVHGKWATKMVKPRGCNGLVKLDRAVIKDKFIDAMGGK